MGAPFTTVVTSVAVRCMATGTVDDLIFVMLLPAAEVLNDVLVRHLSLFLHQILCLKRRHLSVMPGHACN